MAERSDAPDQPTRSATSNRRQTTTGRILYRPPAPLRLLLIADPADFDPMAGGRTESDREWMQRQTERVLAMRNGQGPTGMSADEYERIRAVWIRGERARPIEDFAPPTLAAILQAEARLVVHRRDEP